MLIPVTLAPIILGKLADVPDGASAPAAPVSWSVTLLVIVVTAPGGSGPWRLWGLSSPFSRALLPSRREEATKISGHQL